MQFPQQRARRDSRIYEEHTRQVSSAKIGLIEEPEAARRTTERPLLTFHPKAGLFFDRRSTAAVLTARDDAL